MEVSMLRYAAGRIVLTVPVLFGVSLMSFAIVHLIPGDIVSVLAGPMVAPDSEAAQNIRRALHRDHDRITCRRHCCDGTRTLARSRHSRRCAARPLDAAFLRRRGRGVAALDLSAFVQDPWRRRLASRPAR